MVAPETVVSKRGLERMHLLPLPYGHRVQIRSQITRTARRDLVGDASSPIAFEHAPDARQIRHELVLHQVWKMRTAFVGDIYP